MKRLKVILICSAIRLVIMFALWAVIQAFIPKDYSIASFVGCFIAAFLIGPRAKVMKNSSQESVKVNCIFFKGPKYY